MRALILATLALCAQPCLAMTDLEASELAANIGTLLGSEAGCGFTYDQTAVAAWVNAHVPPDRLDFPTVMQSYSTMTGWSFDKMTASEKTAHCTAIGNSARHLGLMK